MLVAAPCQVRMCKATQHGAARQDPTIEQGSVPSLTWQLAATGCSTQEVLPHTHSLKLKFGTPLLAHYSECVTPSSCQQSLSLLLSLHPCRFLPLFFRRDPTR
jgi:hypothetical protein